MFYSHEILTSRKYGVATVWLVATLGASSKLKKVNRKAIREVDVPKACRTIIDPAAPMALRLQGNLLYGVSRVYLEQCGYVLADAQNAHNSMRMLLKVVNDMGLDPDAGKAKPEQLILQDDPSFLPDFTLPPLELLADLKLPISLEPPRSGESQSLTPFGSQHIKVTMEGPLGGLIIPSSSSAFGGDFGIEGDDSPGSNGGPSGILAEGTAEPLVQADFMFDEDGEFIDLANDGNTFGTPVGLPGAAMPPSAGNSARVRAEHEEVQRAGAEQFDDQMDIDLPIFSNDLPDGETFPMTAQHQSRHQSEVLESSSPVAAPMRKKRAAKVIPLDSNMELGNRDLSEWNTNYLSKMAEASKVKIAHRAASRAKKNAEYWVWGAGIGGIGRLLSNAPGPTHFDRFFGDNLFELYTGVNRKRAAGTKRDRDSGIDDKTQGESRRVRHKPGEDEDQIGRGQEDEGMFIFGDEEVELPRDAPSALDDQQVFSAMPWNMSASIRGSSAVPRSGRIGIVGSVGGFSTGHRGSRLISASPLHGRGEPGGLDALQAFEGDDSIGDFGLPLQPSSDDGSYLEPEKTTQSSVRVREALSAEGENFLTFVADAITERAGHALQLDDSWIADEVLFDELLPPTENNRMVACQGLMMVLALGTKGLLYVRQDAGFDDIGLSLTEKAKVLQAAKAGEEEGGEEGDEREREGDFEERIAAEAGVEASYDV